MTNKLRVIDMLNKYAEVYKNESSGKYFGYSRAISMFKEHVADNATPQEIKIAIDAGIYGIGPSLSTKIKTFLDNGTPNNYDEIIEKFIKYQLDGKEVNPHKHYMSRSHAVSLLAPMYDELSSKGISYVTCGSWRRLAEVVGDSDILIIGEDLSRTNELLNIFSEIEPEVKIEFLAKGLSKSKIEFSRGNKIIEVDFRSIPKSQKGSMLLHFTGPREFNIRLRRDAIKQGWSLNEYGLHKLDGSEDFTSENEEDFFTKLGIEYISPENRS